MLPVCGTDRVGGQPQRLCSFPAPFVAPLPHHGPRTPQHGDTECSWSAESPRNRRGTDSPGGWKQVSFWGGNLSTQPFLSSSLFFSRSPLSHYFMVCQHLPATCLRNSILLPTGRPEPYWFSLHFTLLSCTWTPSPFDEYRWVRPGLERRWWVCRTPLCTWSPQGRARLHPTRCSHVSKTPACRGGGTWWGKRLWVGGRQHCCPLPRSHRQGQRCCAGAGRTRSAGHLLPMGATGCWLPRLSPGTGSCCCTPTPKSPQTLFYD